MDDRGKTRGAHAAGQGRRKRRGPAELVVRGTQCATCIYRPECVLDVKRLENEVRNRHGGMEGFRICHTETFAGEKRKVCCRGFWDRWKTKSAVLRTARALSAMGAARVRFTDESGPERKARAAKKKESGRDEGPAAGGARTANGPCAQEPAERKPRARGD